MGLQYLRGNATLPGGEGDKIIAHVVNDKGAWGKGFVLELGNRYPLTKKRYKEWSRSLEPKELPLGTVQFVQVEPTLWVANMVGQHDIKWHHGVPPVRYDAICSALRIVCEKAVELCASVHMPRIGCGLGGGVWSTVEPLVQEAIDIYSVDVFVYDFDNQ